MLLTHTKPHSQAPRPVVTPVPSIGATLAALQILQAGSLAAALATAQKSH